MLLALKRIDEAIQLHQASHIYIAYSGGLDSHVLLHACVTHLEGKKKITAVYVNHGLQAVAAQWEAHCQGIAQAYQIDFIGVSVDAQPRLGESPEEAARNARYAALKSLVKKNDLLLLAQHREDQMETVLLQLFRGSGLRGLAAMPAGKAFGQGYLIRPLLDTTKAAITAYAKQHALQWVEDPTNQQTDYDRNYLRLTVLPLVKQRWPGVDKTIARTASHCAQADAVTVELATIVLGTLLNNADNSLPCSQLNTYSVAVKHAILRAWLKHLGIRMPALKVLEKIDSDVVNAREDSMPQVTLNALYSIRRYQQTLYCVANDNAGDEQVKINWPNQQQALRLSASHRLCCEPASSGILLSTWANAHIEVRFRSGGEKICLPNRRGFHSLKKLFQEASIPPWQRTLMPLIYLDQRLAAVGEHWISADFYQEKELGCVRIRWLVTNLAE